MEERFFEELEEEVRTEDLTIRDFRDMLKVINRLNELEEGHRYARSSQYRYMAKFAHLSEQRFREVLEVCKKLGLVILSKKKVLATPEGYSIKVDRWWRARYSFDDYIEIIQYLEERY